MADNLKLTINKENIESNIKNIIYYVERLEEIFSQLETEFQDVSDSYKTNSSRLYFDKVNTFKSSFPTIISNFISYKNDLSKLLGDVDELDVLLAKKIESGMGDIKNVEPVQRRN